MKKLLVPYKNFVIDGVRESMLNLVVLNTLKLNIFNITDSRISVYSNNFDLLPPKHKSTFRNLKKGVQEFHKKFALTSADKAASNVVVVWKMYYMTYINTEKQELITAKFAWWEACRW